MLQGRARGRVLAVDDQACFRATMRELLNATDRLEIVAEAESGERAIELVQDIAPDMVLMDVRMPGVNGILAAREIKARSPATVVVLTSTTHPTELPLAAGDVDAVVWKDDLAPRLLDEIWSRATDQS